MAKKGSRRRRNPNFVALPVQATIAPGALADNTVFAQVLTQLSQDLWVHKAKLSWTLRNLTPGEGPIYVGLASNDLSVTEIKEAIEAKPVSSSDRIAKERAGRPVRQVGQFNGLAEAESLNDGKPIHTRCKFALANSAEVNAYVMNQSGAALTTGSGVEVNGHIFGTWK